MRTSYWNAFILILILTFGLTFNAVGISYSQGEYYLSSYFSIYYPTWLFSLPGTQTSTYSNSLLYTTPQDASLARSRAKDDFNMFYTQPEMFEGQSVHYSGMIYGNNGLSNGVQDRNLFLTNDSLIMYGIFNQISGNYQSMKNPVTLFNQPHAYMPVISGYQSPKLSIQKCLQERPDLDTSQCILLHRDTNPTSFSTGYSSSNIAGSPTQFSGVPSTDYLSLYFICFEGS